MFGMPSTSRHVCKSFAHPKMFLKVWGAICSTYVGTLLWTKNFQCSDFPNTLYRVFLFSSHLFLAVWNWWTIHTICLALLEISCLFFFDSFSLCMLISETLTRSSSLPFNLFLVSSDVFFSSSHQKQRWSCNRKNLLPQPYLSRFST